MPEAARAIYPVLAVELPMQLPSVKLRYALIAMDLYPAFDELNSVEYLYLRALSEPPDSLNSLRVVVEEAVVNPYGSGSTQVYSPELAEIMAGAKPIESTSECRAFELYWKHYIAYLVTEECVGGCGGYHDEEYVGKLLRIYTKSHFLDHLARDTGGHFKPIQHYKIICLDHLVDVASVDSPEIRQLGPGLPANVRMQ